MRPFGIAIAGVALAACVLAPPAQAQSTVQGEAASNFVVTCTDLPCSNLEADAVVQNVFSAVSQVSVGGSFARTSGSYSGDLSTPVLRSWTKAEPPTDPTVSYDWSHSYVGMLQGYTWTGAAQQIDWVAELEYLRSPGGFQSDVLADFWLLDASFVPRNNPFQNIIPLSLLFDNPFNGGVVPCDGSHSGILGYAMLSHVGVPEGSGSATLSLGSTCEGTAFVAQPGQEFYLYATLITNAIGGAETNAFNSLRVGLSPDTSAEDVATITRFLVPTVVPEPATWTMMILGFGAMGAAFRRGLVSAGS